MFLLVLEKARRGKAADGMFMLKFRQKAQATSL
jgi:hypothetical protein